MRAEPRPATLLYDTSIGRSPRSSKLGQLKAKAAEHVATFRAPSASNPVLTEVARRLVEAYQPERIYLFRSVARGDAGPDSDYDLLVVVPDEAPSERRPSRRASEVLWGTGVAR